MHCFMCVTYLMIVATAHPPNLREVTKTHEKRSIFNDVIQSLRIRAQLPKEIVLSDENNLGQDYDKYGTDEDPLRMQSDADFMPRRNDRIEMPTLNYRFPKMLSNDSVENKNINKDDIVLYVSTPNEFGNAETSTQKPKKQKKPKPGTNKLESSLKGSQEYNKDAETQTSDVPIPSVMAGQSQIGHRESQTVVKPTVIVNFRGSVMHRESDIRLERRKTNNDTIIPQNVFNINQEIKLESKEGAAADDGDVRRIRVRIPNRDVHSVPHKGKTRFEEDMMMCETSAWKDKVAKDRSNGKREVLQILVAI